MSAVVVEIGADATAFQKAVDGLPARMNAASGQMAGAMTKVAGSGNRAMGQMAMQVQDVVVQLQMGTKWTTVMAQQGSQMLSAFGAGGAIAGGLVALAGAFITMGENAQKAFQEAQTAAEDFNKEVANVGMFGSTTEIGNTYNTAIKRAQSELDRAGAAMQGKSLMSISPIIDYLGEMLGTGPNRADVFEQANNAALEAAKAIGTLEKAMIQMSEREAQIAELRAAGRKDEADEMERQLKLSQAIAKVQSYGMSPESTKRVVSNLERQYAAPRGAGGDVFQTVVGSISRILPEVIGPVAQVVQAQLMEQSKRISTEASALRGAAFGGLRGDVDTSYGRGTSINPLNNGAARMVSEMVKQSALLQAQARSMDKGNGYLAEIEKAVKKFNTSYQ